MPSSTIASLFFASICCVCASAQSSSKAIQSVTKQEPSLNGRFESAKPELAPNSSKIRNWRGGGQIASPGDFLSRLWTLFGKPGGIGYEGYGYLVHDKKTGLVFEAYSGASGPSYGGDPKDVEALEPVLVDFDRLLETTKLTDCEIEYDTDFGVIRAGAKNGIPFEIQKTTK